MTEFSSILSTSNIRGAYKSSQELTTSPVAPEPQGTGESFADVLRNAAQSTVETTRQAEAVAQQGLTGKVGAQQVVEATLELESTVKVMISMRDKVVEAYQEIIRMPI
ncbi:flagellar hook-basal body complex protein FliE [Limimaricola variabilis]|jgi:flagellar hook-basal body complex protein FliE|uniref:Flagellar hook-basal body complex protein FliE n=1 Tax=Limimaricola variabilis TaxID=1492771 RepID=A0ABR6HSG0_9RHOB|nr:flagellar hook-basal body complex protein FliE [Limimaricola variabilis]MBB3713494.1 flagellar hook-basal body complex protein FliE [Limimaricola variabilis]WPY94930.1 flagellar hook-basal body complex protein FliE [Limimaricola variabilis]